MRFLRSAGRVLRNAGRRFRGASRVFRGATARLPRRDGASSAARRRSSTVATALFDGRDDLDAGLGLPACSQAGWIFLTFERDDRTDKQLDLDQTRPRANPTLARVSA